MWIIGDGFCFSGSRFRASSRAAAAPKYYLVHSGWICEPHEAGPTLDEGLTGNRLGISAVIPTVTQQSDKCLHRLKNEQTDGRCELLPFVFDSGTETKNQSCLSISLGRSPSIFVPPEAGTFHRLMAIGIKAASGQTYFGASTSNSCGINGSPLWHFN
jgi:hypothetical protein